MIRLLKHNCIDIFLFIIILHGMDCMTPAKLDIEINLILAQINLIDIHNCPFSYLLPFLSPKIFLKQKAYHNNVIEYMHAEN